MAGTITVGELLSDPTSNNKITVGSGTTLDLVNGAGSVILPETVSGKVLQVLQSVENGYISHATNTVWHDLVPNTDSNSNLTVTITPTTSTSKFLISTDISASTGGYWGVRLVRNGVPIYIGKPDSTGSITNSSTKTYYQPSGYQNDSLAFQYLDETTLSDFTAITYKLQVYHYTALYLGGSWVRQIGDTWHRNEVNSLTVMEIAL